MKLFAKKNRAGGGLYSEPPPPARVGEKLLSVNPIQANRWIKKRAQRFEREFRQNAMGALESLLRDIEINGREGIRYSVRSKGRAFNASEVIDRKEACCLDETFLFLSICNQAGLNTAYSASVGFLVFRLDTIRDFHACGGVLVESEKVPLELQNLRFRDDTEFQKMILSLCAAPADRDWSLVLLDFTQCRLGAQHSVLIPMTEGLLLSSYLTNTGSIRSNAGHTDGVGFLRAAFERGDPLAVNNLLVAEQIARASLSVDKYPIESFHKLMTGSPFDILLGHFLRTGHMDGLEHASLRLLQVARDHPVGLYMLGMARLQRGEREEARRILLKAYERQTEFIIGLREVSAIKSDYDRWRALQISYDEQIELVAESAGSNRLTNLLHHLRHREIMLWSLLNSHLLDRNERLGLMERHLSRNRLLSSKGHSHAMRKLSTGSVDFDETTISIEFQMRFIEDALRAGRVGRAQDILEAIKEKMSPMLRETYQARVQLGYGPSARGDEFLLFGLFSRIDRPELEPALDMSKAIGYEGVTIDREAGTLSFDVDGHHFFVLKTASSFADFLFRPNFADIGNRISGGEEDVARSFWRGAEILFGLGPEESLFVLSSRKSEVAKLATVSLEALDWLAAQKVEEIPGSAVTEEALRALSRAIESDPHNPYLYQYRSLMYDLARDVEKARKDWATISELDPQRPIIRLQISEDDG